MREPLDHDDHFDSCCDPVDDEIKRLRGDKTALLMLLKECKSELQAYQSAISRHHGRSVLERRFMLIQQIDDELKSE